METRIKGKEVQKESVAEKQVAVFALELWWIRS
jgi:hypothetical protein